MSKTIHVAGKRKRAVAKATLRPGTGKLTVNNLHIDQFQPKIARLKIQEPLLLVKQVAGKVDIDVKVHGGGFIGQADAARLAIGRALVEFDSKIKDTLLDYDRQLLVADIRRKEVSKPNSHGSARSKRQKSYR